MYSTIIDNEEFVVNNERMNTQTQTEQDNYMQHCFSCSERTIRFAEEFHDIIYRASVEHCTINESLGEAGRIIFMMTAIKNESSESSYSVTLGVTDRISSSISMLTALTDSLQTLLKQQSSIDTLGDCTIMRLRSLNTEIFDLQLQMQKNQQSSIDKNIEDAIQQKTTELEADLDILKEQIVKYKNLDQGLLALHHDLVNALRIAREDMTDATMLLNNLILHNRNRNSQSSSNASPATISSLSSDEENI